MQIGIALLALLAASALGQNDEGRLAETSEEELEAELENELKRLNAESTVAPDLDSPTKESSTKPLYEKPVAESPTQCTCPPALPLATAPCTAQFEGYVRYNAAIDDVEYCTKGSWSGAKLEYGSESNPATSCQSLYDAGRTDDGIFYLKPKPTTPVFKSYCYEGYTLVMNVMGRNDTFNYKSKLWTSKTELKNPELDPDKEVLLPSYWTMPIKEVMIVMKTDNGTIRQITIPFHASSLFDVIADNKYKWVSQGRKAWKNLVPESSLQTQCNQEGFNVNPNPHSPSNHRVRIGIVSNNEFDCWTTDSHIGVGADGYSCVPGEATVVSGNGAGCWADNGDKVIYTTANVFIK